MSHRRISQIILPAVTVVPLIIAMALVAIGPFKARAGRIATSASITFRRAPVGRQRASGPDIRRLLNRQHAMYNSSSERLIATADVLYTVKRGDSLSTIASHLWGKAADWPALWYANRKHIPNPVQLRTGQVLQVPQSAATTSQMSKLALKAIPKPPPAPASSPSQDPVTAAPAAFGGSYGGPPGSFQACVIQAESGGNPTVVNPSSGAGGLYGFLPSTWQALGFSGLPENAPVSVQNEAFAKEYALVGTSAWAPYDGC